MSKTICTLRELAGQSLLRDEDLAISALEVLSNCFFPLLFKEAFNRKSTKILSAILQVWPYPRLPLGALMKKRTTQLEAEVEVVLNRIDMLLDQKDHLRKCKLEVLDLRTVGQNWNMWSGPMADDLLSQPTSENQAAVDHPEMGVKQPLKVLIDLYLKERPVDSFVSFLFRWGERRKGLIKLYCNKLQILSFSLYVYRRIVQILDLDSTRILNVNSNNSPKFLLDFAPYMGCMRELRTLLLFNLEEDEDISSEKQKIITVFTSQFLKLECLQRLHMDTVPFLEGHLDKMLRCVKTHLKTLGVTYYKISKSEWRLLPGFSCISQLVHLNLRNAALTHLSPEPFRDLLVKIAPTLMTLNLEDCCIVDAQLNDIIPALSRCTQLTTFNLYGNEISMSVLKELMYHTKNLNQLTLELYPVPLESYNNFGIPSYNSIKQYCDELMDILRSIRQPLKVSFGTRYCFQCNKRYVYKEEEDGCNCWN